MQDTGKSPRILIVEDDADINRLLYKILKKNGYAPEQAFSGTEARLLLQAARRRSLPWLRRALILCDQADRELKSSLPDDGRILELLLLRMAA